MKLYSHSRGFNLIRAQLANTREYMMKPINRDPSALM